MNIPSSDLYALIGAELNKEYATIKLEQQDVATLKSLVEEKDIKSSNLEDIIEERKYRYSLIGYELLIGNKQRK